MLKSPRVRWLILLSALGLTLAAAFYPTAEPSMPAAPKPVRHISPGVAAAVGNGPDDAAAPDADVDAGADPFAPRGWQAPAPALPPPVVAPVAVAPVDVTPAGPPELPFRFVGSLNDGVEQTVYLARGEQAYVAHAGDILETNYKVLGITATQIEFEHIPTGTKQALAFPVRDN